MKKSDLKHGNVVECKNGYKYLYCDNYFINLTGSGYLSLDNYHEDLTDIDYDVEFNVMKVYKDYTLKKLLWERKDPKFTEDEKAILKVLLKEKYKWIARDKNGCLYVYASKPEKVITIWEGSGLPMMPFNHLFQFIKWEDDEPYSIEELLEGEKK